ncbi:MAG: GTP pyrophosphokinase family protein [Bacilli bacterium]|nr:GTP pyrophosphokinase family protein [Bacilli bacterium]
MINFSNFERTVLKYEYAKRTLETEIAILIDEFVHKHEYNPVEHVKSRIKSQKSIVNKLVNKGYVPTINNMKNNIYDIVGIRIVCSFLTDVYDIVSMISKSSNIIIKERRDYISNPKKTGYSSYHLIVLVPIYLSTGKEYIPAEIQIRTIAMDFWASLDHKISYKFDNSIPKEVQEEMYKSSLAITELDRKMLDLNELVNKFSNKK